MENSNNKEQLPVLQQTDCSKLREILVQLQNEELMLAKRNKRNYLSKVYHNENERAIRRVIQLIDDFKPVA